jgi:sugar phosphate isomerase/epimerase
LPAEYQDKGVSVVPIKGDAVVSPDPSRREWLSTTAVLGAAPALATENEKKDREPFRYCLNTSTIRGQKRKLIEAIDIAARAGYQAIEPWLDEIEQHVQSGGSLKDASKRLRDRGLEVPSAIGFAEWIVDDEARRKKAFERLKQEMDWLSQLGAQRIAAPPAGATNQADLSLSRVAERYRALLELGDRMGVVPQVELWGFSKCLSRLGEVALVAVETRHPRACILPDVFHLYKGGSDFAGLRLLSGAAVHVLHVNDYPADPPRATVTDAHRLYPGDGVAPYKEILHNLRDAGFRGFLSLELFNRDYWMQDALQVARTGLDKLRTAVRRASEGD